MLARVALHLRLLLLFIREHLSKPHRSQLKPRPQRISSKTARHRSSVPNRARNAGALSPRTLAANLIAVPASDPSQPTDLHKIPSDEDHG